MKATDKYNLMNNRTTKIKNWVESVRGKILGHERRAVYRTINDVIGVDDHGTDLTMSRMPTEEVLILEIPMRELEHMSDVQNWYLQNIGGFSQDRFSKMINDHFQEKSLRESDLRLKDLYDKYKVMLALISERKYTSI